MLSRNCFEFKNLRLRYFLKNIIYFYEPQNKYTQNNNTYKNI